MVDKAKKIMWFYGHSWYAADVFDMCFPRRAKCDQPFRLQQREVVELGEEDFQCVVSIVNTNIQEVKETRWLPMLRLTDFKRF